MEPLLGGSAQPLAKGRERKGGGLTLVVLWVGFVMGATGAVEELRVTAGSLGSGLSFAADVLSDLSWLFLFSGLRLL